jgi:predicted enzyme related to lactoylglutathione lyase
LRPGAFDVAADLVAQESVGYASLSATAGGTMASKNGKICYIELPATDAQRSADFYSQIFGWTIRSRGDGAISFDDTIGEVSGSFDLAKKAVPHPGFIVSIMVDDIRATIEKIRAFGCEIVDPLGFHPTELIAHFRDPGGNLLGLYQEPK